MAAPVLESSTTNGRFVATTAWTSSKPAGVVAGDLLIAIFNHNASAPNVLTGWTAGPTQTSGFDEISTLYRAADGSEGATFAFTMAASATGTTIVLRISAAAQSSPIDGSSGNAVNGAGGANPMTVASFTTTKDDDLLIGIGAMSNSSGVALGWTLSPSTGWTKSVDLNTTNVEQIEVFTKAGGTAGAIGAIDWTLSSTSVNRAVLELAVKAFIAPRIPTLRGTLNVAIASSLR